MVGVQKNFTRKLARVGVVLVILVATCGISIGFSAAAKDPCGDVWQGATPNDPLGKVADKTEAHPGDQITYTFSWHSTGDAQASIEDCYRVDTGSDSTLNGLVDTLYKAADIDNQGDNGSAQTWSYTITVPNDPSLIGHSIVNRAKMTHGSVESRTDLVSVAITCAENCDGGSTDGAVDGTTDGTTDGQVDGTTDGTTDGSVDGTTDGTTDGQVDGTTDGTTDGSVDGTTDGTTDGNVDGTTDGSTDGGTSTGSGSHVGDKVLGRTIHKKPLATTGSETTALALIGFAMLMLGVALRFGRFGHEAYAVEMGEASPQDLLAKALRARARDWTCRK